MCHSQIRANYPLLLIILFAWQVRCGHFLRTGGSNMDGNVTTVRQITSPKRPIPRGYEHPWGFHGS